MQFAKLDCSSLPLTQALKATYSLCHTYADDGDLCNE